MAHLHALVVDDSPSMRKQLSYALARIDGMATSEAGDGAEAWRKLASAAFDIVLTDINMPVMDGLKLISLIRGEDNLREMPIIVITTEGAKEDRERAIALGANEYLTKPIQANKVLRVAQSLLKAE
jgi:two-component system chemotaxis response regulator CheY